MLPSEVLMGPARTDYHVGPPGLGKDTLSWDPQAETITTYASTGLGRASRLDVGFGKSKGRSYEPGASAAFGHCPTGRISGKPGSSGEDRVMTPAEKVGARSPGPIYHVAKQLEVDRELEEAVQARTLTLTLALILILILTLTLTLTLSRTPTLTLALTCAGAAARAA